MTGIKFEKLPLLLKDMRRKQRKIELFAFQYNEVKCIVLLTLLEEEDNKRTDYTVVNLEFLKIDEDNNLILDAINATADFYKVLFYSSKDFYDFFNINMNNSSGNKKAVFVSFSDHFSKFIPEESTFKKFQSSVTKKVNAILDPEKPNSIYCFDVRRSGSRKDGTPYRRSLKNSDKAQRLCPDLFKKFQQDTTYSFYFSDKLEDKKSDIEIMKLIAKRKL